ncbi:hypothetical protein O0I10_010530 [Lichtheimia ornata]|uniref:Uncharacterized protein n=1 Tax=Lichtheimia ornata TaxID=688661 RepID=A0AAD7UVZ2_9FUNG|nr:uncharacterized protein O0I10_010530 [Lichtheimia ornata]KAJ8653849.1 hypothetical protein O0I10_010530 [Lichtheimia ornata]
MQVLLINEPYDYDETAAAQHGRDGHDAVIGSKDAIKKYHKPACITYRWIMSTRSDNIFRAIKPYPSISLCFWLLSIAWMASCNERLLLLDHIRNEQQAAILIILEEQALLHHLMVLVTKRRPVLLMNILERTLVTGGSHQQQGATSIFGGIKLLFSLILWSPFLSQFL